jgi:hypothetical protein
MQLVIWVLFGGINQTFVGAIPFETFSIMEWPVAV